MATLNVLRDYVQIRQEKREEVSAKADAVQTARDDLSQRKTDFENAVQAYNDAQSLKLELEDAKFKKKDDLKDAQDIVKESTEEEIDKAIHDAESLVVEKQNQLDDTEEKLEEKTAEYESTKEDLLSKQDDLSRAKDSKKIIDEDVEDVEEKLKQAREAKKDIEKDLKDLEETLVIKKGQYEEFKSKKDEIQKIKENVESDISHYQSELDKEKNKETEDQDQDLIDSLERDLKEKDTLLQNVVVLLEEKTEDLDSAETKKEDAKKAVDEAQSALDNENNRIVELEDELKGLTSEASEKEKAINEANDEVELAKNAVKEAESVYDDAVSKKNEATSEKNAADHQLYLLHPQQIQSDLNDVSESLENVIQKVKEKTNEKETAEKKKNTSLETLSALEEELSVLENKLDEIDKCAKETELIRDTCNIRIARADGSYPKNNPDSFIVGFLMTHNRNLRSKYVDTRILYKDIPKASLPEKEDIVAISDAWDRVRLKVYEWAVQANEESSIVGRKLII